MSLKQLAKKLAQHNDMEIEEELSILKRRQRDINRYGFLTAFKRDNVRIDEYNAYEKYKWQKENKKLGGNENENY